MDIVEVMINSFLHILRGFSFAPAAIYLSPPGYTWFYEVPQHIAVDLVH